MFLGGTVAFWISGFGFTLGIAVMLVSLTRLHRELNTALPADKKVSLHPPLPHSLGQLVWRYNLLVHALDLIGQYKQYYPMSVLPRVLAIALIGTLLSFIGLIVSSVTT